MRPHEPDGINDALAGAMRVALTVAAQLAERAARASERQAREADAASEQEQRDYQTRYAAERSAAHAALALVQRDDWWQHAEVGDIARAWETAQTWGEHDPEARAAAERIHDELQARYGIDTRKLDADPEAVREALAARAAGAERGRRWREAAEAHAVGAGVDRLDAAQDARRDHQDRDRRTDNRAEPLTRTELARSLEGVADPEVVDARVVSASNQGRPAAEAAATDQRRAPRAQPRRGLSRIRDRSRSR